MSFDARDPLQRATLQAMEAFVKAEHARLDLDAFGADRVRDIAIAIILAYRDALRANGFVTVSPAQFPKVADTWL